MHCTRLQDLKNYYTKTSGDWDGTARGVPGPSRTCTIEIFPSIHRTARTLIPVANVGEPQSEHF